MEILDDLSIDKFALEKEAERQPELMRKYGLLYAKAKDETLRLKRIMDFVESEQAEQIKVNPARYGVSENTRGNVSDAVAFKASIGTEPYIKAFNRWAFAREKEFEYGSIMDAIKDRGYMIKILVELWLNNYYSELTVYEKKKRFKPKLSTGSDSEGNKSRLKKYSLQSKKDY